MIQLLTFPAEMPWMIVVTLGVMAGASISVVAFLLLLAYALSPWLLLLIFFAFVGAIVCVIKRRP